MEVNSEKLKQARKIRKLSQAYIAEKLNVSQPLIMKWEKGQVETFGSIQQILDLAAILDITPAELVKGDDAFFFKELNLRGKFDYISLPLLAFSDILAFLEKNLLPKTARSISMIIDDIKISKKSFCVKIEGDAMVSLEEPAMSYYPGEIAAIDPEKPLSSGDVVLVLLPELGIKIRQYIKDGSESLLKAFNRSYQNIKMTDDAKILGIVVFTQKLRSSEI